MRPGRFGRYAIRTADGVQEAAYLPIGGIEQYIRVRGRSRANPVLLVLHGGPGSTLGATACRWQGALEAAFTVVHWDQRGSGNTYYRDPAAPPPTVERLLSDLDELVDALRAAKDEGEIALMTKAQEITDRAFSEILKFIQPGMTEQEIAAKLQYDMLRFGAEKMSFDPIVVSGPNGSLPHGIPSAKQVQQGEFITMDFGCKYGGYCSDMTRTVALGEPTGEMRKVYQTVLEAQLAGIAVTKAGVPGKSIDAAARKVIEDAGYGEYFGHGYGHSLGIEIHESPNANTRDETLLPVGAVVSAEPGIYLPGKFGVRIEDVTVLTADGCMVLTKSPKELIIL